MAQTILSYQAAWNYKDHKGQITLKQWGVGGGAGEIQYHTVDVESADEMRMLVDLLRNEAPVYYAAPGVIRTAPDSPEGAEKPGK